MKQWVVIAVFALCMLTGLMLGDAAKVFGKAVKICLECIGIG